MKRSLLIAVFACVLLSHTGSANDRRFTYTYETSVLPQDAREIEIWNTYRTGRESYFRRLDQRVEYEVGLGSGLMTALYLNVSSRSTDSNGGLTGGSTAHSSEFSVSNEWKIKLSDRSADLLGTGLYAEATVGLDEVELEGKLLLDKQIRGTLFALNVIGEYERETGVEDGETEIETETTLEFTAGVSQAITKRFSAGIEARSVNNLTGGIWNTSVLYAGPVVSYVGDTWWATMTFMPQVRDLTRDAPAALELTDHERTEFRLLLSFHL